MILMLSIERSASESPWVCLLAGFMCPSCSMTVAHTFELHGFVELFGIQ